MSQAVSKSVVLPRCAQRAAGDRVQTRSTRGPAKVNAQRLSVRCAATVESTEEAKKRQAAVALEGGGNLKGDKANGKDAGPAALKGLATELTTDRFYDKRWKGGRWDYSQFAGKDGETDWDAVIDAEVRRRRILEDRPEATTDEMVVFDTSEIPWTAWVKRFHLPAAESVNGRAAMIGFFAAYMIDLVFGVSIVDQCNSFLGHCAMGITFAGIMAFRRVEDLENLKEIAKEATFYDKQWAATWENAERPSETEK